MNYERITKAVINGYRYETNRGLVTTEDLFSMSLTNNNGFNLDEVAKSIYTKVKNNEDVSFVNKNKKDKLQENLLKVVKEVINYKLKLQEDAENAKKKAQRKQQILEILASKEQEELKEKSTEDLLKELEELE